MTATTCAHVSAPSAEILDALVLVAEAKAAIKQWQAALEERLSALDRLAQAEPEANFKIPVWSIYRLPGKVTYAYPPSVKAIAEQLKQEQELSITLGLATPKAGKPFWTVKEITE